MELPAFAKLMTYLPWGNWKEVAVNLLRAAITANTPLTEVEHIEQLFSMITPLLRDKDIPITTASRVIDGDEDDGKASQAPITLAFKEEQLLVAKVVHLMKSDDTDIMLKMYHAAKAHFTNGGSSRIQFTLAPLVFGALSLTRKVYAREKSDTAGGKSRI
jgi:vacuolar protein sorting-associated protein 35